jgi:Myb DNA-binding like
MYGTDFEAIARLMAFRTRAEIKRKFNAEDKRDPALVTDCLLHRRVPIGL